MPSNGHDVGADNLPYRTATDAGISGPIAGTNKLWLSVWSGETIHAYDEYNMFESLVDAKTISNGVAMEFPITGTVSLNAAWVAGKELVGSTSDSKSATIAVKLDKRPIAAHFEIDNVDLMQTQWEFRSELARQAGLTLANARDKQIAAYVARAAAEDLNYNDSYDSSDNDPALLTGDDPRSLPAGPVFINAKFFDLGRAASASADRANAALAALQACEDFVVYLQTINAPTDGVYLAVEPRAFQDIRALGVARSGDILATGGASAATQMQPMFGGVAMAGGLGAALTQGLNGLTDSLEYMGVRIIKSNHLPVSNYASGSIGEDRYCLTFGDAGICGLLFQRNSVAALKLQGLKVDTLDDIRRNTTFTVASMMAGTGVLRPECAAVLVKPTATNTLLSSATTATLANIVGGTKANVDLFFQNAAAPTNGATVCTAVAGAASGGTDAHVARRALRTLMVMTREVVNTAAGAFPYN
jgi:hypothetical protein